PRGAVVTGRVVDAKRAGRIRGRAEMALAFEKIIFPDGFTAEISAALKGAHGRDLGKMRPGDEKVRGDTAKAQDAWTVVNTGVTGGGIGAITGVASRAGGKGTAIGGGAGALGGLVAVLIGRGPDLILERGTQLDLILKKPFVINKAPLRQ